MSHAIEIEVKFEVPEAEFQEVLQRGVVVRLVDQLNIYFDQGWRLANASATCRVRLGSSAAQLTVKVPVGFDGDARTMLEIDQDIEPSEWRELRRAGALRSGLRVEVHFQHDIREALLRFGVSHLSCAGWARTRRHVIAVPGIGELELDRLRLPNGGTIYEIEIEHPDPVVRRRLEEVVYLWAPSAKPSKLSKFEHFRRCTAEDIRHAAELPIDKY